MDGVICDFDKRKGELEAMGFKGESLFSHPTAYKDLEPIEGAIDAFHKLNSKYEVYILSTPAWSNPASYTEKRLWVEKHLGPPSKKKLILSHNKGLLIGDYLVDDRIANGVADFKGEHIHFGQSGFENWDKTLNYLLNKI